MNRVQRILDKYSKENISFGFISEGCAKVAIDLKNGYKRILSLDEQETGEFIHLMS